MPAPDQVHPAEIDPITESDDELSREAEARLRQVEGLAAYETRLNEGETASKASILAIWDGRPGFATASGLENLIQGLWDNGHATTVVLPRGHSLVQAFESFGLPVLQLPFSPIFDLMSKPAIAQEIATGGPDVVLSFGAKAARAVPQANGYCHIGHRSNRCPVMAFDSCDHVILSTLDRRDQIEEEVPANRFIGVPEAAELEQALSREAYGTPDDCDLLYFVGSLRGKRMEALLTALAQLPKCFLWSREKAFGGRKFRRMAKRLDVFDRCRQVLGSESLPSALAAADMILVEEASKSASQTTISAWGQGKPVLVLSDEAETDQLALDDDDRLSRPRVPGLEPMALAEAIASPLKDPDLYDQLVMRGFSRYCRDHLPSAVLARYEELLAATLGPLKVDGIDDIIAGSNDPPS